MLKNLCILVGDVDAARADRLDVLLRDLGSYVVATASAAEAMSVLRLVQIDVAVLGDLPDATAAAALVGIRAAGHRMPIIALAGGGGAAKPADATSLFDARIEEPLTPDALERVVLSVLGVSAASLDARRGPLRPLLH